MRGFSFAGSDIGFGSASRSRHGVQADRIASILLSPHADGMVALAARLQQQSSIRVVPSMPSRRTIRRVTSAPHADNRGKLAASKASPAGPGIGAWKRTTFARHAGPPRCLATRRHRRSRMPSAASPGRSGKVASRRSHARKSVSGSRYNRQQQRPSRSKNCTGSRTTHRCPARCRCRRAPPATSHPVRCLRCCGRGTAPHPTLRVGRGAATA